MGVPSMTRAKLSEKTTQRPVCVAASFGEIVRNICAPEVMGELLARTI